MLVSMKRPRQFIAYLVLQFGFRLRLSHVSVLPVEIDIEPNNWCNFRCDHCQVTHWDKPKSELDIQRFSSITKQFPALSQVKVQGMGEPFLNKSTINMLEYLDKQGIASTTISNGSVLTDKLIGRLRNLNHHSIGFSLDGGTKQTFEGIRIRGNFEKVTDNIAKLIKKSPKLPVSFWVVVSHDNHKECTDIVTLAKRLGVTAVTFQTFITNWGKSSMRKRNVNKSLDELNIQSCLEQAVASGKQQGIQVEHYQGNSFTKTTPCKWPWTSMMIDASGHVIPCCVLADSDTLKFGNVLEQNVVKIWNSDEYKNFRKAHATGDIPEVCKACYRL